VGIGAVDPARVKGTNARPMCLRAAEVVAKRNLLEATKGVQIDSQTTVKDFVTESDTINASVQGFVKGRWWVNKDYLSDGTCEVTVRMSLSGKFAQTIIPKPFKKIKSVRRLPRRLLPRSRHRQAQWFLRGWCGCPGGWSTSRDVS